MLPKYYGSKDNKIFVVMILQTKHQLKWEISNFKKMATKVAHILSFLILELLFSTKIIEQYGKKLFSSNFSNQHKFIKDLMLSFQKHLQLNTYVKNQKIQIS